MVKRGRPSIYSKALADKICKQLSEGMSLREICRAEGMPAHPTVLAWVVQNKDNFSDQYARARDVGLDVLAEQVLEIADDAQNDWMQRNAPDNPGWDANGEHMQRSRLRFDARRWYLSKLAPKRYGDKLDVAVGGDPEKPIHQVIEMRIVDPKG